MIDFESLVRDGKCNPTNYGRFECNHSDQIPTVYVNKAQVKSIVIQCLVCGGYLRAIPKAQAPEESTLQLFNETLRSEWDSENNQRASWETEMRMVCFRVNNKAADEDWWKRYTQYLSSPAWADLRQKVLKRANGMCESCREQYAAEVHHLNYDHVFDEPCFDLVAICHDCHERITMMDRERRKK